MRWASVLTTLLLSVATVWGRKPRNAEELSRCVKMAEPLVYNPDFVFPLSNIEIQDVCRMWAAFVDCIRDYTTHFLTPDQLDAFGAAIEPSMQSIHELCAENQVFRAAYLEYAPCMKKVYISSDHCGDHYKYLADLVQGNAASNDLMCCAHHKFRQCVLSETPRECGRSLTGASDGRSREQRAISATQFVTSMLDRALGFLLQQCTNYKPTEEQCPGFELSNSLDSPSEHVTRAASSAYSPNSPTSTLSDFSTTHRLPLDSGDLSTTHRLPLDSRGSRREPDPSSPPLRTYTNFNRDVVGNEVDDPRPQQFRGISAACAATSSLQTLSAAVLVVLVGGMTR